MWCNQIAQKIKNTNEFSFFFSSSFSLQKYTPIQSTKTTPPALVTISSPTNMPSLAALSNPQQQQHQQQQQSESLQVPQQIGATKIVQIKTAPTIQVLPSNRPTIQNLPPLIPTQQPTFLNIQQANRQPTIQTNTSTPSSISYITTNQTDAKPIGQTFQSAQQQQQQKYSPVVVQSPNVKGKTIILANTNAPQQKTIILRSVGADGNTILQQVPISSVSGLQSLTGNANNIVLTQGAGSNIIKTSTANQQPQFQQIQTTATQQPQQIPALVPTSYTQIITNLQQPQNQQQPQTRLVLTNSGQNQVILPQGLTLIQRWVITWCDRNWSKFAAFQALDSMNWRLISVLQTWSAAATGANDSTKSTNRADPVTAEPTKSTSSNATSYGAAVSSPTTTKKRTYAIGKLNCHF